MPPHLYERVEEWTHEPLSNFNHKKHLLLDFAFSALIKSENTKNIFTFLQLQPKPKTSLLTCISLLYIFILFSCILFIYCYFILLIAKPCAWKPHGGVGGIRQRTCLHVAGQGLKKIHPLFPESSILNSKSPLWGKILLLHHSTLGVPTNWHTCLVSSVYDLFDIVLWRE
jgi:hypothetical protein